VLCTEAREARTCCSPCAPSRQRASRDTNKKCVEDLKKKKVLETRYERLDHRLYYRINRDALDEIMEADLPIFEPDE
jgi:hypothetical protein